MRRILTLFMLLSLSLSFAFAQGKPFKGFWEKDTTDEYHALYNDLYAKSLKTTDKSAASYRYLQSENDINSDVWVITQVLSLQGNNAKVKTFSWRYGSPNDQVEATLTYNPATKVMTYQRSDFPITFQPTPPINSLVLMKTYRNRDIKHELIFLSFEKRDGWVFINEESSSVYEDGRISMYLQTQLLPPRFEQHPTLRDGKDRSLHPHLQSREQNLRDERRGLRGRQLSHSRLITCFYHR